MFAVKGWSVDAGSLKPQTEAFKQSKSKDGDADGSSKKRKRSHKDEAKQDPNVRLDDVGRLWDQHVDGKDLSKSQKSREHKKQKLDKHRDEKTGPYELPNAMSKPKGQRKIEKWEDIVLGTRAEKYGYEKKGKKNRPKKESGDHGKATKEAKASTAAKQAAAIRETLPEVSQALEPAKLTPMQSAMRQKLISARFRHLNETLYTEPSKKAQELFAQDPQMFEDYHSGFRQQVSVWPENPLDKFIAEIRRRGRMKMPKVVKKRKANASERAPPKDPGVLPRTHGICILADLGCGDARLAQTLEKFDDLNKLRLSLQSFDLYSPSKLVTKTDISKLPLKDDSIDIAILSLALMGTNWISFIEEAHRVLHWKGELWIAEIKSRFGRASKAGRPVDHSVGGKRKQAAVQKAQDAKQREQDEVNEQETLQTVVDGVETSKEETDVSDFVKVLKRRGFILKPPGEQSVDLKNKMFVKMEFMKALDPTKGKGVPAPDAAAGMKKKRKFVPEPEEDVDTEDEAKVLKPCLYKIR